MTTGTTTPRVVFFHFGKGSGDLVTGIALANAFRRAGIAVAFTAVSDNEMPWIARGFMETVTVLPEPRKLLIADRETELYRVLKKLKPDVLIVYGTWLPMYPIINDFSCLKVLMMRQFNPPWLRVDRGALQLAVNPEDYDLAVSVEPNFHLEGFRDLPAVVIRNREEIYSRAEARARLGVPEGKKLLVVARNGYPGELEELLEARAEDPSEWHLLSTTNRDGGGIFPLADYAAAIDLLVSGGGYSTFYETRYFGIPAELSAFERNAENIAWRLETNADYYSEVNGADVIVREISSALGKTGDPGPLTES